MLPERTSAGLRHAPHLALAFNPAPLFLNPGYGLIDHGYAFACQGHPCNTSPLVEARACYGDVQLDEWEVEALKRLLATGNLGNIRDGLDQARADALQRRAESMLAPTLLPVGSF